MRGSTAVRSSRATARRSSTRCRTAIVRRSCTPPTCAFTDIRRLSDLNPWIASKALPRSELIAYRDVDGKQLYGVLRYPVGYVEGRKYPTVFEIYETFFDNGFNARAAFLANHGYAVFHPSVNLVIGRPGEAWVKGVTSAANRLIELGIADPDRLGVHGTSYGGYATALLITQTDRFKAAINVSGKVDMVSFYTDSPRLGVRNTHAPEKSQDRIGGTLWEYPERYLEHSAILRADRIKTPLLNITGDQDPNVPGEPVARDVLRDAAAREGSRVGALRQRRPPSAEQRRRERRLREPHPGVVRQVSEEGREEEGDELDSVSGRSGGGHVGPPRLGLRAEKCTSGERLTMAAPARVIPQPAPNQLGVQDYQTVVANQRLRGSPRLRRIFRTDAPRWPNCAAARHAPPPGSAHLPLLHY